MATIEGGARWRPGTARVRGTRVGPPIASIEPHRWSRGQVDHSNTVALLADRAALKLFRRIEPAPSPELEIGRFLDARGFTRTPPLAGALEYLRPDLEPGTLAVLQAIVKHQGTGWDFAIEELRRYYERVAARATRSDGAAGLDRMDGTVRISRRPSSPRSSSGISRARPRSGGGPRNCTSRSPASLAPRSRRSRSIATASAALANQMRAHGDVSLDLLGGAAAVARRGVARHWRRNVVAGRRRAASRASTPSARSTTAGSGSGFTATTTSVRCCAPRRISSSLDFEGDPAQSIAERRAKQSPLKDVAGMIRSYGYAAYAAMFAFALHAPDDYAALEPWAGTWAQWTADAFLKGYLGVGERARLLPRNARARDALLSALVLDKALRELGYELHNRPDWVRVPLAGVSKLIRSDW